MSSQISSEGLSPASHVNTLLVSQAMCVHLGLQDENAMIINVDYKSN